MAALAGSFGGLSGSRIPSANPVIEDDLNNPPKGGKGQLRTAKPKSSNAARLKREAKKRNNIRKRK